MFNKLNDSCSYNSKILFELEKGILFASSSKPSSFNSFNFLLYIIELNE